MNPGCRGEDKHKDKPSWRDEFKSDGAELGDGDL